jgi:protein-S-isoprenylcysteine O-methyltransferase Ste14
MLGLVAYLIHPATISWSTLRLPPLMRWAGVTICTTDTALLIWTLRCLGRNLTDTVVTRREHTLITTGPYRWVRHPFYGSAALFIFGTSLLAENWFLLLIGGLVLGLLIIRTHTEEQMLLCRFGESYRVYMQRTGRSYPGFERRRPESFV